MQTRMEQFPMTAQEIDQLLHRAMVGRISTIGEDGYPYTVAVHFVYDQEKIYIHGARKGEKLQNLKANPKVCFEVDEFNTVQAENLPSPCKADSDYESVVIRGNASILDSEKQKAVILGQFVEKYTPAYSHMELPEKVVAVTGVIEISIERMTGKYHH